ncbi:MAG: START domain-containing protein [Myxococcota bacterium]
MRWSLGLPLLLLAPAAHAGSDWEELSRDPDGITSWQREVEGSSFVAFRAQGKVEAPLLVVAGVLHDSGREKDWMEDCVGSANLISISPIHEMTYNRTGSPVFFISDRDVVLESSAALDAKRQALHIEFHEAAHPAAPRIDGVVRMPRLRGYWDLEKAGPSATLVTYQVEADPGGSLPSWLVNWASKELSANTIRGLRKECKKGAFPSDLAVLTSEIDWDRLEVKSSTRTP